MKKGLIFLFALGFLGEANAQQFSKKYRIEMKKSYVADFKLTYFKKLLLKGFSNAGELKRIFLMDRSGFGEPILSVDDLLLIDSLTSIDSIKLVKDSISRIGKVSEGSQGKPVFGFALARYQSKYLDRLARQRLKIFDRNFFKNE